MRNPWLQMLDCVLRPARPEIERCLDERARHVAARRQFAEQRARALANCERRIQEARTLVFAADDGVVPSHMTALEREWRLLARRDPDEGLMDLWARIAPASAIDRKRWRDSEPGAQLDAAVALGADAQNVEVAEQAIGALRRALAVYGTPIGGRIRWAWCERDTECVVGLLAEPLRAACAACPADHRAIVLERAQRLELSVHEAALARFPARPCLARDLAHAAFVDFVWRAAALGEATNPVTALCALWQTGYVLSEVTASSVTVEIPPFAAR
jgi:hypothetical protein